MDTYRNGLHYGSMEQADGKWSREGGMLVADYLGDQGYRRKWSATPEMYQLKLVLPYPLNFGFDTPGVWPSEYQETDLTNALTLGDRQLNQ